MRIVDSSNTFTKPLKKGMMILNITWRLNISTKKEGTFGSNHLDYDPVWESTPNYDPCPNSTPMEYYSKMNMV